MLTPTDRIETLSDRTSNLLELATQKFGALTNAEEKLFRAAANGEVADYSADSEEDNDPARAGNWGKDRLLNANRIAWLCTDPQASVLVTHRGIRIKGARIDGELDLQFANISFPLFFEKSAFPECINLMDAEIRALAFSGTHIGLLSADRLKVEGNVFLQNGFKAEGEVRLLSATIGGNLNCGNCRFINKGAKAFSADRLKVEGNVFLQNGFKAEGEVRLIGATIGGFLDCSNGQFINKEAKAFNADKLKVEGNVFLRNGFKAEGEVRLIGATIDGHLILTGVVSPAEMALDLYSVKVGTLWDDRASWPTSGKLLLHGLIYDNIHDKAPTDVQTRIDWLRRQPGFQPQPYEQLAAVLRKSGRDKDAKQILIAKNKDPAQLKQLTFFERLKHRLLGWIVGYGYRPWQAFLWVLGFVALGWVLFGIGFQANVMLPTKKEAYVSIDGGKGRQLSDNYPKFNPLVYSIDMFVPLVDLHQSSYWLPNANQEGGLPISKEFRLPISGSFLCIYLCLHIVAGWILTTLLVVSLSGLIRG